MRSKEIALSSLFSIIIFSGKILIPAPYDKVVSILLQIMFLSLAFLIIGFLGPILTGFVSGLLTALVRGELGFMTFIFALLFGIFVSVSNHFFGVVEAEQIRMARLTTSTFTSTLLVGILSAYTSITLGIIPYNPTLISTIIITGAIQGLIGGYISGWVWKKYFRNL